MKQNVVLLFLIILTLTSCTQRSAAVVNTIQEDTELTTEIAELNVSDIDLQPLTQSSLGQGLVGSIQRVETVKIVNTANGEVVYQSNDDVLSQGFYDALQVRNESLELTNTGPFDYEVSFTTSLGMIKEYSACINFSSDDHVIVQYNEEWWGLSISESNWLRAKIGGLV